MKEIKKGKKSRKEKKERGKNKKQRRKKVREIEIQVIILHKYPDIEKHQGKTQIKITLKAVRSVCVYV